MLHSAVLWIAKPDIFPTRDSMINIAISVVLPGLVALPQTLAILSAGIDVSVGSTVGLSSIVAALVAAQSVSAGSAWTAIGAALVAGTACGAFNGIVITYGRVNPFIVTLATDTAFQGLTYIISQGQATAVLNPPDAARHHRSRARRGCPDRRRRHDHRHFLGVLVLGVPQNGLLLLNVNALYQPVPRACSDRGRADPAVAGHAAAARTGSTHVTGRRSDGVLQLLHGVELAGHDPAGRCGELGARLAELAPGARCPRPPTPRTAPAEPRMFAAGVCGSTGAFVARIPKKGVHNE